MIAAAFFSRCLRRPPHPARWLPVLALVLAGCAGPSSYFGRITTPAYEPSNVYQAEPFLAPQIRRVAVLPVTVSAEDAVMEFGRDTLGPILTAELGRVRQFELVSVAPAELQLLTGRAGWSGEEKLPQDFFDKLKNKLAVDAVLFSRLTQYRAYEPLAVGWRLKLVETEEPRILWSVDEVFDARVPEVAAAAIQYGRQHPESDVSRPDARGMLMSPGRFGRYTAAAVVQTLPGRALAGP
jgi:hypothetical protein